MVVVLLIIGGVLIISGASFLASLVILDQKHAKRNGPTFTMHTISRDFSPSVPDDYCVRDIASVTASHFVEMGMIEVETDATTKTFRVTFYSQNDEFTGPFDKASIPEAK